MRLLLVEDEPKLNQGIARGLHDRGYSVDSALDGVEGERLARLNEYDLVILDIMMPKRDGLTVCRNLRSAGITVPVLFLTAKDATSDKVKGLDDGGDDYLIKPFAFEELAARVRTLLRRPREIKPDILELDGMQLDTRSQTISIDGKAITLTLREFGMMEYFLRNRGTVLSRDDILEHVWDHELDSLSNVVDVHLKNLRKKLPKAYAKRIETVWGKGYRVA